MRGKGNVALDCSFSGYFNNCNVLNIYIMQKNNSTNIYLYPGKCGVRSLALGVYCLKGANCICLDEYYESDQHFFINQGRMQDNF